MFRRGRERGVGVLQNYLRWPELPDPREYEQLASAEADRSVHRFSFTEAEDPHTDARIPSVISQADRCRDNIGNMGFLDLDLQYVK
jgi:hypothetical protein